MPDRLRRMGQKRRSRGGTAWRYGGGVVVAGSAACAFLALGMTPDTAPRANADIEDLIFQPIIDALGQVTSLVDPSLASAVDGLDVNSLLEPALAADVGSAAATAPLQISDSTEPLVDISVNGGSSVPVLVDTGSDGLVIPIQDIGFQTLSFPTGLGVGSYSGGLDYFYLTFDVPVNFGDGIVTSDAPVDVALFEFPTTFESFLGGSGDGILGIGPDSVGPGPDIVTTDLPAGENEGVFLDEATKTIEFGPNPDTPVTTLTGAPITDVLVSINGGAEEPVTADFDSGGVYGTIPESVLPASLASDSTLPAGTDITVYTTGGTELYSYTTTATDAPAVVSSGDMDTGNEPFSLGPIYIDTSGTGETVFDYSAT